MQKIINNVLRDTKKHFDIKNVDIDDKVQEYLCALSNGDARIMLNTLEIAVHLADSEKGAKCIVTKKHIEQAMQKENILYDKNGEEHHNLISALHKSMRGGDANASVYYLARMLSGGEDPIYIARRIVRFASEDIGLANSFALPQAVAVYDACRFIGMPECGVNLTQAVVYMAKSKKSIAVYDGYKKSMEDVKKYGNVAVPIHLRNAPTQLMKSLDYGKDYKYTPLASNEENNNQSFLPEELTHKKYI